MNIAELVIALRDAIHNAMTILSIVSGLAFITGFVLGRLCPKGDRKPPVGRCDWLCNLKGGRTVRCELPSGHTPPHVYGAKECWPVWWTNEECCAYRPGMKPKG